MADEALDINAKAVALQYHDLLCLQQITMLLATTQSTVARQSRHPAAQISEESPCLYDFVAPGAVSFSHHPSYFQSTDHQT